MGKTLILYYSLDGSTKKIAAHLAEKLNADIERIRPVKDIKVKGFLKYVVGGGMVTTKRKPKLIPLKLNPEEYDTIFIGSPIWAGYITPSISTLLEKGLIKNKKVAIFYTYKGGNKTTDLNLKQCVEKNNTLLSIFSCLNVDTDLNNQQKKSVKWGIDLIK